MPVGLESGLGFTTLIALILPRMAGSTVPVAAAEDDGEAAEAAAEHAHARRDANAALEPHLRQHGHVHLYEDVSMHAGES